MSLTVVITRDVEMRYRGFLGSAMLEIAPGVYLSPRMSKGVRERVWGVLHDWHGSLGSGAIVMVWRDKSKPGDIAIETLGTPPKDLIEADGLLLARRPAGSDSGVR
ncbi:type I-E CRISPR-associated endoribonuclease Cas2e [Rhodomicrobium sp. Az07]|uniref:type I-E CRISPR-associated endoribonuclease Cas2e n=1 Tax=Rhodomicrobium sp. Az07 TaxID=2839034 RepID=UPI001BEC34A4|nr:type I-E CRISPR-associated endoribonuclease Cas2e [Rhodomicrobium sp. Az07]